MYKENFYITKSANVEQLISMQLGSTNTDETATASKHNFGLPKRDTIYNTFVILK